MASLGVLSACTAILGIDTLDEPKDASVDARAETDTGEASSPGMEAGARLDATVESGPQDAASLQTTSSIALGATALVAPIAPLGVFAGSNLRHGEALAFSQDGEWLAIGVPGAARQDSDAGNVGYVELVQIDSGTTGPGSLTITVLDPGALDDAINAPTAGASFGHALAFSPSGRYLAVGAPQQLQSGSSTTGNVYLYESDGGAWSFVKTYTAHAGDPASFGSAVAWNDGPTPTFDALVVGCPGDSTEGDAGASQLGVVYIYGFPGPGGGLPDDAYKGPVRSNQAGEGFGWSVAVSSHLKSILVGAPFANQHDGRVYLMSSSDFEVLPSEPYSASRGDASLSGYSVALSSDGLTGFFGAPGYSTQGGGVLELSIDAGGDGGLSPSFLPGSALVPTNDPFASIMGSRFGQSLAVDSTGYLVAGAPGDGDGVVLTCLATNCASTTAHAPVTGLGAGAALGATVATSYDGKFAAVTAPGSGTVYFIRQPPP